MKGNSRGSAGGKREMLNRRSRDSSCLYQVLQVILTFFPHNPAAKILTLLRYRLNSASRLPLMACGWLLGLNCAQNAD